MIGKEFAVYGACTPGAAGAGYTWGGVEADIRGVLYRGTADGTGGVDTSLLVGVSPTRVGIRGGDWYSGTGAGVG